MANPPVSTHAELLSKAPETEDALCHLALAVEQDQALAAHLQGWDATVADGLEDER